MTQSITIPSSHPSPSPTMSKLDQTSQLSLLDKSPSSPSLPQQQDQSNNINSNAATTTAVPNSKRKPARRANTAERRATHNAVERQRREMLNGRFLDLAALLPNLSQVRRPSKSSIVNSSIAHIHTSRRHRLLAARELRLLKLESDAVRREVNEWRNRAGITLLDEPVRSEAFSMVISGELEVLTGLQIEEEEEDMPYAGFDGEDDGYPPAPQASAIPNPGLDALADPRVTMVKSFSHCVPTQQSHYNSGNGLPLAHILSRPAAQTTGPMITSPTTVAFENPVLPPIYDNHPYQGVSFLHSQHPISPESEKINAWNAAQLYHSHANTSRSVFSSPPGSSSGSPGHSSPTGSASPGPHSPSSSHYNENEFFNIPRSQQQQIIGQHPYGPPTPETDGASLGDRDPEQQYTQKTSIVPAVSSVRERSRSLSSRAYEPEPSGPHGDYSLNLQARRATHENVWFRDGDIQLNGINIGLGVGVGMNPVTVGGGNGNGFAMMMM